MSEEYKQELAEIFDARAINYDEDNLRARLANRLVEIAKPQPAERVLDIATGTGLVAISTARMLGESGRVVGVDISKGMLNRVSRAALAEGLGNIEYYRGSPSSIDRAGHLGRRDRRLRDGLEGVVSSNSCSCN